MTFSQGVDLSELRESLGLRPMSEFEPDQPARLYDNLNGTFLDWQPQGADHYRQWARPDKREGCAPLVDYDGLELLGWLPVDG